MQHVQLQERKIKAGMAMKKVDSCLEFDSFQYWGLWTVMEAKMQWPFS